ncbi:NlpC/P60 family protein [Pseudonocardia sp.]|uniref:NlpC/P60 family protein n=1 Tax=Pseudonocardia sp. TaxID=60912 RepID=UPI0031FD8473
MRERYRSRRWPFVVILVMGMAALGLVMPSSAVAPPVGMTAPAPTGHPVAMEPVSPTEPQVPSAPADPRTEVSRSPESAPLPASTVSRRPKLAGVNFGRTGPLVLGLTEADLPARSAGPAPPAAAAPLPAVRTPALPRITTTAKPGTAAAAAIAFAIAQRGLPYVWGGDGPQSGEAGFDCSGLTTASYDYAGISLPRTAHTQYYRGPHLPAGAPLQPGDLVFYGVPEAVHHVGLYIGGGRMINAPTFGEPVRTAYVRYPGDDYLGATRPAAGRDAPGVLAKPDLPAEVPPVPAPDAPRAPTEFRAPPAPDVPQIAPQLAPAPVRGGEQAAPPSLAGGSETPGSTAPGSTATGTMTAATPTDDPTLTAAAPSSTPTSSARSGSTTPTSSPPISSADAATNSAPTSNTPADPTGSAQTGTAPTGSAPPDTTPSGNAPANSAPADSAPTDHDSAPTGSAPAASAPAAGAPGDNASTSSAPARSAPARTAPTTSATTRSAPASSASAPPPSTRASAPKGAGSRPSVPQPDAAPTPTSITLPDGEVLQVVSSKMGGDGLPGPPTTPGTATLAHAGRTTVVTLPQTVGTVGLATGSTIQVTNAGGDRAALDVRSRRTVDTSTAAGIASAGGHRLVLVLPRDDGEVQVVVAS